MLHQIISSRGGVVRTRRLIDRLVRIRRGWVALPDADPGLVFAARTGLALSCAAEARRLKIWVRARDPQHFAIPRPCAERRPEGATLHSRKPLLPREPFSLVDRVENVLRPIAHCRPHEDAVAAWDSALNRKLVDRRRLERRPPDAGARKVLEDTSPFSDSGLESYVRLRLRWMRVRLVWQAWLHGHRVDLLIGERLVLQLDGAEHTGAQRTSDIEHDAELRLLGHTVIRIGYEQVMSRWPEVQAVIMEAIAQGLHVARKPQQKWDRRFAWRYLSDIAVRTADPIPFDLARRAGRTDRYEIRPRAAP